jgi:4-aminobutyrate aminotransferase-like enzyme/Ser/Thr protein kinase RdoA (MazF antagonist)
MQLLKHAPRITAESAKRLAFDHFDLTATAVEELPSERDQNFLISTPTGDRYVLKVSNALEDKAFLQAQQEVFERLAQATSFCPRIVSTKAGDSLFAVTLPEGTEHFGRLVRYLPGVPLASVLRHSPRLLRDVGHCLGTMDRVLDGFDHPACHRDFHWDLARAVRTIDELSGLIADADMRTAVNQTNALWASSVHPHLEQLRRSVIHGDANDHNLLVDDGRDLETRHRRIVGVIDFGDMVHSFTVANLAVAAAYAALDKPDPLLAAAQVVAGYHAEFPLLPVEFASLFGMFCMRLALSASVAASQQQQRPDDQYLAVSQGPLRRTLPRLLAIHASFAEAVFRQACGLPPNLGSEKVAGWLRSNSSSFRPILDVDLRTTPCVVLDLSVASPLVSADAEANAEPLLTSRVSAAIGAAGVAIGVGRYNEPRLLYSTPLFAADPSQADERRTIHLGLDLFSPPGAPIHAPLAGVVHALANNTAALDYGPVVILHHQTDDGQPFFTLYGHLAVETLSELRVGQAIGAGQRFATIGGADVNGGWTPHVHFQLITDLLDIGTDFPGVAPPSRREVWLSFSPDPNLIVGIPRDRFPKPDPSLPETLATRLRRLGRNLSIAYRQPLKIVRGWKQLLFDHEGRRFLDAYNNVAHVGHCHPRVVEAGQSQMAVLNTNTRYLHDLINEYAARLTATLPKNLPICYFLNSASEANELALRLARTHTRRRDMIVLDAAYHGHTNALIDISPYKHAGPGGAGAPPWVHVAPIPDGYRGLYKYGDPHAAEKYAGHVRDIIASLQANGDGPCAFIAETCPSVAGQIMLPQGYLSAVYRDIHAAGGICIADEVQTGLGRCGTHFWTFADHGVVPDIVVMGKPMGNGHPLAAVVTTPAIADSFNNGMEFFSTYGGNPVSCAIGLAVLDVLRDEGLQEQALRVGRHMLEGLGNLMNEHTQIGDVRGSGFFLGVELVRGRQTLEPATEEATLVVNRLRDSGILLGTDGPFHNVIKIRPPMPFSQADGDLLVATLDRILKEEFGS